MFLQEPKADAFLAEVGCQACWSSLIEYLNLFLYFLYNDDFGLFKKGVEIVCPFEHLSSASGGCERASFCLLMQMRMQPG